MSSLAYPARPRPLRRRGPRMLASACSEHGSDVLLGVAMAALFATLLVYLQNSFSVDSWLELVTGRVVWQHGIPWHETLTALAWGKPWVDQQWLAQLTSYAEFRVGGIPLVGFVNVALLVTGTSAAVIFARRLGASARSVLITLPLCAWLILPSREVRTQAFVIPLFVLVVYLLARDSRSASRRVYWCLPILVLWSNLHGTATLGAMLVALRGLTLVWERRVSLFGRRLGAADEAPGGSRLRAWVRPAILIIGAPLCLLVTPYGLHAIGYYHAMLFGTALRKVVSEWQPVTSVASTAAAFFLAAGIILYLFGRERKRSTLWEKLVLIALMAGTITVVRNAVFFTLAALVIVPRSLEGSAFSRIGGGTRVLGGRGVGGRRVLGADRVAGRSGPTSRAGGRSALINLAAVAVAGMAALLGTVANFTAPASRIEYSYQRPAILKIVEQRTSADPSLRVFADVRFGDWLLWRDRALTGRLADDARFELLTAQQLGDLEAAYGAIGPNWKRAANGYGLIVADRDYEPHMVAAFEAEPGARVLYDDGERVVILRRASA